MAYVKTTRAVPATATDRISGIFAAISAMLARRRVYDLTIRELRQLTDRELSDLGIARSLIIETAREAAYGK
ncbi:DUF1127 domain-containing protein [Cypionkella sp. TWP1-2-1b2]|uniref:DUF1127 domain-containing protein n=1 Tax=Cypionkella sp. TWP1-2-1b2 TaxID=2804675 RepID=UPI003CF80F5F